MKKKSQGGFSVIEAALVVTIGGVLLAFGADALFNYLKQARMAETRSRLAAIDEALGDYVVGNGSYPCPASLQAPVDDAAFGVRTTDDCLGAAVAAGTFRVPSVGTAPNNTPIRIGAVPVRTLNLPDQFASDGWGNRFYYAVTERLASPGNAAAVPLYAPNLGSITVVDSAGNQVAMPPGTAHYVVISPGENHVGAFSEAGAAAPGVACSVGTLESMNCANTTGRFRKTLLTGVRAGANTYDDLLIYRASSSGGVTPVGMTLPYKDTSGAGCPIGWALPLPADAGSLPALGGSFIWCRKQ